MSARVSERKRHRPLWVRRLEERSRLAEFFTGGIEIDSATDPERLERFTDELLAFLAALRVSPRWGLGVEVKFRRLGRHRADGLYYPLQRILVLGVASWASFAHEFGHLLDHRGREGGVSSWALSGREDFSPYRNLLVARMRGDGRGDPRLSGGRGRLSWRYFASPSECFARSFEQFVADRVPHPSSLVYGPERYRSDPLFFRALPREVDEYFREVLASGPCWWESP